MLKLKMTTAPSGLVIFMFVIWLYTAIAWTVNLVQLVRCDFSNQTSWKEEVIHAIGLIPFCSWVTVWL